MPIEILLNLGTHPVIGMHLICAFTFKNLSSMLYPSATAYQILLINSLLN